MSLTVKQQRLVDYNSIIVANMNKFKAGSVLSRKRFTKLFKIPGIVHKGSYAKVHRSNLRLVQAQTEINALMAQNGLYMKSENYYENFVVVDKKRTKQTIVRYSAEVDVNKACTTRLENNMKSRIISKTWGYYSNVSSAQIKSLSNKQTLRHSRTIQRVKAF